MSETARILIVDDERNIRFTLAQAIASSDRSVVTAMNGEEALHCLEQDHQVILLDLQLPGMSGLEILREIRQRQESARSGDCGRHGNIDNAVEAMKLGAADFLQKPLVPEQVRSLVNRLIHQRAAAADPATDYFNRIVRARQLMADGLLEAAELEIRGAIACDRTGRPASICWGPSTSAEARC